MLMLNAVFSVKFMGNKIVRVDNIYDLFCVDVIAGRKNSYFVDLRSVLQKLFQERPSVEPERHIHLRVEHFLIEFFNVFSCENQCFV